MAQVLKPEVRQRIAEAALAELVERGYAGTTMAGIAARAGVAPGNLYRYHRAGKEALLATVLTDELVARHDELLDRRVRSLAHLATGPGNAGAAGPSAPNPTPSEPGPADELLDFWVANRLAVAVLLDGADGSPWAGHGARFVDRLVDRTEAELVAARGGRPLGAASTLLVREALETSRRVLARILARHPDEAAIRHATEGFWAYQLAGLQALAAWAVADDGP